ncbi:hypothetical protein PHIM7_266 [Sinorhizobium phage phiM7]|uniref:Transmembrane protein n=2 Tax=Emdodecavirus TaxID=1980937 RepID=S5MQ85_9CAUD|nr:hypothetical protein AB690_gp242 [Sinorhizobium phage phiM12]YP_009601391.1 hypothetical protein FDH46_gp212 [Sinorhizobium phage phiM7]AGR47985.2 hypothetical protein SmphiM12_353 [Sinorhizobium phage phiM12]AKF12811.1 hypothetical protein PHIM7_266 [Sinorhizobium phage phiM7]AKF13171.1 hypothetical protein PHIM19_266 [Sinorhizobium phage phiM19]
MIVWYLIGIVGCGILQIFDNILDQRQWDRFDTDCIGYIIVFAILGPISFFACALLVLAFIAVLLKEKVGDREFYLTGKRK